ncbi:MAG: msbA 2 [Clostridia bacterium]|nr:msbA 2 [Clostridia bacterium]
MENRFIYAKRNKFGLLDGLLIPFKFAPIHTALIILQQVLNALIPTINVFVTANFINAAIATVYEHKDISTVFMPLFWFLLLFAISMISQSLIKFVAVRFILRLREKLRIIFTEKRAKLSYEHIENQDSWDLISRVAGGPEDRINGVFNDNMAAITGVINIVGVIGVLSFQLWWAGALIVLVSIPLLFLAVKSGKATYDANREVTKIQRKYNYLGGVLTGRDNVEERALFGYSKTLNEKWREEYEKARNIEYKTQKKWFIKMKTGSVLTALISIFVVFILINPVITGAISIGMFISLINAVFGLIQAMSWQLAYIVDSLTRNREYMKDLTAFVALDEKNEGQCLPSLNIPEFESLEFKDVKFKYPKTENYILKGLSLKIEKGRHYSFVGINGAGKTTVTKLITGLYDNYEGEILLNGNELKSFPFSDIKALCSAVFQDFARYSITFKDNVALGDINNMEATATNEKIKSSVALSGLEQAIEKLSEGMNTPLGKIKEKGVDLSGGEWQRVAMARALINPAPLKILDEPTAALDPVAESMLYQKFEEISKGHTTVFISHRLGSTKLADIIYVIDGGVVSECGSHEELMEKGGYYAEMFESQRSWYK